MELIDSRYQILVFLLDEIKKYDQSIVSEQDVRLKVINRVFVEVLGWSYSDISTEENSGGGFLDYKFSINGLARLIVEAKKDDNELGVSKVASGRHYKLNGPVFKDKAAVDGIRQAIRYCGQKNAELAVVTNGTEWIVFRGSRLGDGHDTMEGVGFVFPSLGSLESNFKLFYGLLSYDEVATFNYRAYFQEAEGRLIRPQNFKKSLRTQESIRLIHGGELSGDLERVMNSFFQRLSGDDDPDMLRECFVVTSDSTSAEEKLARISEDLIGKIKALDTDNASELTALLERVRATRRNEFVLIVGTKGAGKSTFIDRFFAQVLPEKLKSECVVARINLSDSEGSEGTIHEWLNQNLLESLESEVFGVDGPTYDQLLGLFFDEYKRRSEGALKHLYEKDKEEFKIDFGRHIEERRESRPHDYIRRLVEHIVSVRKKVPCLVFDNADHFAIEFQERVFQFARSIYEEKMCMVIMPITDRTSWQLFSKEGALRSFENESLFLPTPSPKTVLEKRIQYIRGKIYDEEKRPGTGYFVGRGIALSVSDINAFASTLNDVFLKDGNVARWIGSLANNDLRRCLDLSKLVVSSPHLNAGELLKMYISKTAVAVPTHKIKQALLRSRYDIYSSDSNRYVRNVFDLTGESVSSPLVALRMLHMLEGVYESESGDPFIEVDQIVDYFRAMLIETNIITTVMQSMLDYGLCLSYDPTITKIEQVNRVELSPSGMLHWLWAIKDSNYMLAMSEVTPVSDRVVYETMHAASQARNEEGRMSQIGAFVQHLIEVDAEMCKVPSHDAYIGQLNMIERIKRNYASCIN